MPESRSPRDRHAAAAVSDPLPPRVRAPDEPALDGSALDQTALDEPAFDEPAFDEMVTGAGRVRPGWAPLLGALHALPPGGLALRAGRVAHQYEESRIAYAGEPGPTLDPVPMLLPAAEWIPLAAGIAQRARLLALLAADIYGERRLLVGGAVPAGAVFAGRAFLRPCADLPLPGGSPVHAYAADLLRLPDGRWHVAADRLQAPSGIGLALHSRAVLARTMPELFRTSAVPRLEPFFELWAARLAALAPPRPDGAAPRVAVLTPGPFSPNFLEHVLLARQLGCLLVEGGDLTVREGCVHLKTLASLQRVDVLLRFMDDEFVDPLELRSDSVIGVPGLLQAVRGGRLALLNPPGTGVVESPALRPHLPDLCRLLLGEALRLPSLPAARPGEPAPARSLAPSWGAGGLEPRPVGLRVFALHDGSGPDGAGFAVLPGGCTELLSGGRRVLKDTWLVAGELEPLAPPLPPSPPGPARRPGPAPDDLRSRNADDLFWLGRYAERLDNAARLQRAASLRLLSQSLGPGERAELSHLARLLGAAGLAGPDLAEALPEGRAVLAALRRAWAPAAPLGAVFGSVRNIAHALRGRLSRDVDAVVLGPLQRVRERLEAAGDADELVAGLETLVGIVAAFGGMAGENMTQGGGWRFLDLGRRLERCLYACAVLAELEDAPREGEGPLALALELSDSAITYHSRYLGALQAGAVAELLLADMRNPRSVGFQLRRATKHLRELSEVFSRPEAPGLAQAGALLDSLLAVPLDALAEPSGRGQLSAALLGARAALLSISDAVSRAYFAHTRMPLAVGFPAAGA